MRWGVAEEEEEDRLELSVQVGGGGGLLDLPLVHRTLLMISSTYGCKDGSTGGKT